METMKSREKKRPQISFNISLEDHEIIKKAAFEQKMSMRVWIINAMAEKLKRENDVR